MKCLAVLIVFACLLTAIYFNIEESPDPIVVEKLELIVTAREQIAEEAALLQELGKGDPIPALIALSEAKVNLATEQRDFPTVISELENTVELLTETVAREKAMVEEARLTQENLGKFSIELLEAEIRLQHAKAKHGIE